MKNKRKTYKVTLEIDYEKAHELWTNSHLLSEKNKVKSLVSMIEWGFRSYNPYADNPITNIECVVEGGEGEN